MKIQLNLSALGRSRWYEYAIRFLFGGAITALAGIIAKQWGPSIGGLFLAFPAIFPSSATLIEKHEAQKEKPVGHRTIRGRKAAALDAAGAALGTLGLITFGLAVWQFMNVLAPWMTLALATVAWLGISVAAWKLWRAL